MIAFPALVALRRANPDASLVMAGNDALGSLLRPYVARYVSFDDLGTSLFQEGSSPPPCWAEGARIALWMSDPNGIVRANLARWGAEEVVYVSQLRSGQHAALQLMASIDHWGLDAPVTPRLELGELVSQVEGPCPEVLVHPGSGSAAKNWPLENFLEVAYRLRGRELEVAFLLGPVEEAQGIGQALSSTPFRVLRGLSIVRVAYLLSRARAYVGNDSGISHLSGLVGCPTVAVFGSTDPAVWSPLGAQVKVLGGGKPGWPSVQEVLDAVVSILR